MKVAITSSGKTLDSQMDPRFGRCPYFIIADTDSSDIEAVENQAVLAPGGAGVEAAQSMAEKGVESVVTGQAGPNAFRALSAAGIQVYTGATGTVKEALEQFTTGKLSKVDSATVDSHFGMGRRGGGQGRGRQRW